MKREKRININTYPTKWKEFLDNSKNEDEAIDKYWRFCRSFCLEKYILKYGEEKGKILYYKKKDSIKYGMSLDTCIKRHGEEKGTEIYNKWRLEVSGSLENFIKRYGEVEGKNRFDLFRKNCVIKDKYKSDPDSKFNNRLMNTKTSFYLQKFNCSEEEAKIMLNERQSTSKLSNFIKKYGEVEGKKKYQEVNLSKSQTLENFIKRYGENDGLQRFEKFKYLRSENSKKESLIRKYGREKALQICKSKSITLENFIKKYGDIVGERKYRQAIKNNFKNRKNNVSKNSIILFDELVKNLQFNEIYYNDNEYIFFVDNFDFNYIVVDFYIKDINKIIEFYGDYWHRNPHIGYDDEQSKLIHEKDEKRINVLKNKFNCETLVIWEKEFSDDPINCIEKCLKFINNG